MTEEEVRLAHERVCALFDASTADDRPLGRRDAALISVLFGAGVPRATALDLPLDAYDPSTGLLRWPRSGAVGVRRAVEGAREALRAWLDLRGEAPGPLLCRLDRHGEPVLAPIAPHDVPRILARRAREADVRTGSTDALRRHYDSPWWREVPRSEPDGRAGRAPRDGSCRG